MKYKAVYSVLEKRSREVPGFRYDDRSCWRKAHPAYIDRLHSLWIIAEDPATGRRFWITHDGGSDFSISFRNMEENRNHNTPARNIRCASRTDLAEQLEKLFSEPDIRKS